jgi:hypothetical protein
VIATDSGVRTTWTLPRMPDGDSAAARRMAGELRLLADSLSSAQRQVDAAFDELRGSWRGQGSCTTRRPERGMTHDAQIIRRALLDAAEGLDRYAHQYDRAHEHHGWSWGRIAAVATVVAVTATVVTVTVMSAGAATPAAAAAEAAVVGAEAEAIAGAAASASAAAVEAAEALSLATRALSALEGIGNVVLPRLYLAAVEAPTWMATPLGGAAVGGATAVGFDLAEDGRVHPLDVVFGAALGYGEGVVGRTGRPRTVTPTYATPEEEAVAALETVTARGLQPHNRELPDDEAVTAFFRERLEHLGERHVVQAAGGEVVVITLPDGGRITFRGWSRSGGPTIEFKNIEGVRVEKIHRPMGAP